MGWVFDVYICENGGNGFFWKGYMEKRGKMLLNIGGKKLSTQISKVKAKKSQKHTIPISLYTQINI